MQSNGRKLNIHQPRSVSRIRWASVTHGGTIATGAQPADVYNLIDTATVSSIVNADIASNAAIVDTKLATISTAGKVSGAAITSLTSVPSGAGLIPSANIPYKSGQAVQVVNVQDGVSANGTTAIPFDTSIPQKTEGDQFMSLAIKPTSDTNKLKIEVVFNFTHSTSSNVETVALFQDDTADALACAGTYISATGNPFQVVFTHYMTAGTTSTTTFKVRAGGSTGSTTTFNGTAGIYGAVIASSITITEIQV